MSVYTIPTGSRTLDNDAQNPDKRPGAYYASVVDGGRFRLLAGPVATHSEALALVEPAERLIRQRYANDPKLPWYGFGTLRMDETAGAGILNADLGLAA